MVECYQLGFSNINPKSLAMTQAVVLWHCIPFQLVFDIYFFIFP